MTINHDILYSLLCSNMEAQSLLIGVHLDPPDDYEKGPETPENVRPRRVVEFGRNLLVLCNASGADRLEQTRALAAGYARTASRAAKAGDRPAEADYKAYENILNAIVTQAT